MTQIPSSGKLVLGRTATMQPVSVPLGTENMLIGGPPRSGKTNIAKLIGFQLVERFDVALVLFDPQDQFVPFEERSTDRFDDTDEFPYGVNQAYKLFERRQRFVKRAISVGLLTDSSLWNPKYGPYVILMVDEYHILAGALTDKNDRPMKQLIKILNAGLKLGICVIVTAHKITKELSGGFALVSEAFVVRVCAKPESHTTAGVILGLEPEDPECHVSQWPDRTWAAAQAVQTGGKDVPGVARFQVPKAPDIPTLRERTTHALESGARKYSWKDLGVEE